MNATFVTVFTALISLAVVAVIVSQKAQSASIIQALGSGVGAAIGAATAPVTQSGNQ